MYVKAGEIMSGSQTGEVSVLVTAEEHFGTNQTLVLLVKVKHSIYWLRVVCGEEEEVVKWQVCVLLMRVKCIISSLKDKRFSLREGSKMAVHN